MHLSDVVRLSDRKHINQQYCLHGCLQDLVKIFIIGRSWHCYFPKHIKSGNKWIEAGSHQHWQSWGKEYMDCLHREVSLASVNTWEMVVIAYLWQTNIVTHVLWDMDARRKSHVVILWWASTICSRVSRQHVKLWKSMQPVHRKIL